MLDYEVKDAELGISVRHGKMKILAPLRGVTIRCFRRTFSRQIADAGFTEAITPFISAMNGVDPLRDRELQGLGATEEALAITPQFIGKDPTALRFCLRKIKSAGYRTADLNCGCPFPMVRNKGRGSGLLRTPDTLEAMVRAGCEEMGEGNFSVKARLGVDSPGELARLMPILNRYPLRFLTVHARTARQMYTGKPDIQAFEEICAAAKMPIVYNGDYNADAPQTDIPDIMVGRPFVVSLGKLSDSRELLLNYIDQSAAELHGQRPVLGRIKELVSYWQDIPYWKNRWPLVKTATSLAELTLAIR